MTPDLSEREREFIVDALREWGGSASRVPLPIELIGAADWTEFDVITARLREAVRDGEPLNGLDWARVQFLTELSFGSDMIGAGVEFATVSSFDDREGIEVLRSLQRKLIHVRGELFPGRGRARR